MSTDETMTQESKGRVYQPWEVADQVQRFCGPDFPLISFYEYQALEAQLAEAKKEIERLKEFEWKYKELCKCPNN